MNIEEMQAVVAGIEFGSWKFSVREGHGGIYLQARFFVVDACNTETAVVEVQYTRKWLLSPHMTKSEIVQTAFKCVLTASEHEVREFFKYKDKAIFGPHYDVDALWEIADSMDGRETKG